MLLHELLPTNLTFNLLHLWLLFGPPAMAGRFYGLGSVLPSVHPSIRMSLLLSGRFRGIDQLVFSETLYGVKVPYGDVRERADFFGKIPFKQKWSKMAQNLGFWTFQENLSISFVRKWCRMKVLMTLSHSEKLSYVGKIWFSSYGQKCSRPIRSQYSLILNTSLVD